MMNQILTPIVFFSLIAPKAIFSFHVTSTFQVSSWRQKHDIRLTTVLFSSSSNDGNDTGADGRENQQGNIEYNSNGGKSLPPDQMPILPETLKYMTAMEQSFREQELELLADLRNGDAAIHKFRLLWYSERGPDVEKSMRQAWKNMGHPDYWQLAETSFLEIIEDTDRTYLFPFVLLSKLYCLQGRFQESQIICEKIIELKPYHFSVLETMVANCAGQQNVLQLQIWNSKRLPKPSEKEKRLEWVDRAIQDAKRILREAERSNLPKSSGISEGILEDINDDTNDATPGTWQ